MGEVIHKTPILFDVTRKLARSNIITIRKIFDDDRREKREESSLRKSQQ